MTEERRDEPESSIEENAGPDPEMVPGGAARERFPSQVEAALGYAAENTYAYGPKYRNTELAWDVVGAREMGEGVTRVQLGYRPSRSFRGESGLEYMDVDAGGAVLARRQIRIPKEDLPKLLMGITLFSVVLAGFLVPWLVFFAGEGGDPLYVAGRTLYVRAEEPKSQRFVLYEGPDTLGNLVRWAVVPEGEGTQLTFVKLQLINQTSGSVNMVIDEDAAELTLDTNVRVKPINIIERAYPTEDERPRDMIPGFVPLWGSVTLNDGEQLVGHLVFETPAGSGVQDIRWRASDTALIRFN